MQREQPFAVDEEAHLVLAMRMFGQECAPHRLPLGMVGRDRRDVDRPIAAFRGQAIDLLGIDCEHVVTGRERLERPALEPHADLGERRGDDGGVARVEQRCRGVGVGEDLQAAHRKLRSASSAAIIHSIASITRSASAMSRPQP